MSGKGGSPEFRLMIFWEALERFVAKGARSRAHRPVRTIHVAAEIRSQANCILVFDMKGNQHIGQVIGQPKVEAYFELTPADPLEAQIEQALDEIWRQLFENFKLVQPDRPFSHPRQMGARAASGR
jgi:hypothetical protein